MQKGVCIDVGQSAILQKGNTYFLTEHGKNNYYVSKFNKPKSHFGSFRKELFRPLIEKKPKLKRFIAKVSKKRSWYTLGDEYIITEKDYNGYFHVYFRASPHKGPIGSYLSNFFEIIEPFNESEVEMKKDLKVSQPQKTTLRVDDRKETTTLGQLNLFDFIDV